jgi:hypothetical protein
MKTNITGTGGTLTSHLQQALTQLNAEVKRATEILAELIADESEADFRLQAVCKRLVEALCRPVMNLTRIIYMYAT